MENNLDIAIGRAAARVGARETMVPPAHPIIALVEVDEPRLTDFVRAALEEAGLPNLQFQETDLAEAIAHVLDLNRPPVEPGATFYIKPIRPVRRDLLVGLLAALVGAASGATTSGMDGIIPGIITAEAGLLINILTNYVSLGTQNREGAKTKDWLEEIILSILRSGNYTHKEIARRTQVRTDKVLECLKRLQQANRVEAVGQIGHDEIIWSRLGG